MRRVPARFLFLRRSYCNPLSKGGLLLLDSSRITMTFNCAPEMRQISSTLGFFSVVPCAASVFLCETVLLQHRVAPRFTELHRENGFSTGSLVPFPVNNLVFHRSRSDAFPKEPFGSAQGAENAKSIGALYTHNFLARLASSWLKKYELIFLNRH